MQQHCGTKSPPRSKAEKGARPSLIASSGTEPSLVDYSYYPFFERFCNVEHYRDYQIPGSCMRLLVWRDAMEALPIVRQIANAPEFYIERAKAYAQPS